MISLEELKKEIERYNQLKSILMECSEKENNSFYARVIRREIECSEYKIESMYQKLEITNEKVM